VARIPAVLTGISWLYSVLPGNRRAAASDYFKTASLDLPSRSLFIIHHIIRLWVVRVLASVVKQTNHNHGIVVLQAPVSGSQAATELRRESSRLPNKWIISLASTGSNLHNAAIRRGRRTLQLKWLALACSMMVRLWLALGQRTRTVGRTQAIQKSFHAPRVNQAVKIYIVHLTVAWAERIW
jgi:hypothetical protein